MGFFNILTLMDGIDSSSQSTTSVLCYTFCDTLTFGIGTIGMFFRDSGQAPCANGFSVLRQTGWTYKKCSVSAFLLLTAWHVFIYLVGSFKQITLCIYILVKFDLSAVAKERYHVLFHYLFQITTCSTTLLANLYFRRDRPKTTLIFLSPTFSCFRKRLLRSRAGNPFLCGADVFVNVLCHMLEDHIKTRFAYFPCRCKQRVTRNTEGMCYAFAS